METTELDKLVTQLKNERDDYEQKNREAKEAHGAYKTTEFKLLQCLENMGKTKYFVDGVGTITKVERMSVQTPKTMEEKKEFFKYLKERGGEDLLYAYLTVNSMALNKFYNETKEEFGPAHDIPGLALPISISQLRFKRR